jgi:hypothetical protein
MNPGLHVFLRDLYNGIGARYREAARVHQKRLAVSETGRSMGVPKDNAVNWCKGIIESVFNIWQVSGAMD